MNRQTRQNIEKAILISLVGSALILSPAGGRIVVNIAKYYLRRWWEKGGPYIPPETDEGQVRLSVYNLKRRNYVKWRYKEKGTFILELTEKGRKFFQKIDFKEMAISTPKEWDGQWRFVLFDIPEKQRNFREMLRDKLKNLKFLQFQKSVWVHPYACEKELNLFCDYLGISAYAMTFTAKIDNDRVLRRYFLRQGVFKRYHLSLLDKGVRY